MMSIMLFILALSAAFLIIAIGAVAFQLTGLSWEIAKFQALSCFSGTGFTTRESELIVCSPRRRKIAFVLIILGNAGIVTIIASVAASLTPNNLLLTTLSNFLLHFNIPQEHLPWINLTIIILTILLAIRLVRTGKLTNFVLKKIRKKLKKRAFFYSPVFEEQLILSNSYGVVKININPQSNFVNKQLKDILEIKPDLKILAHVRDDETTVEPAGETAIQLNDQIIAFGSIKEIRQLQI